MATSPDIDVDRDAEMPSDPLDERVPNLAGCLPVLPLVGLPLMGFPLLPSVNFPLPLDLDLPGFLVPNRSELIKERLASLVPEFGLDVDADRDLSMKQLLNELQSASKALSADQISSLQSRVAEAVAAEIEDMFIPPILPISGLPVMGFPILPSFNLLFDIPSALPSFMIDQLKDAAREKFVEAVAEMGIDVDLERDIPLEGAVQALKAAGADLDPGQISKLGKAAIKAMAVDPADLFVPPILPLVGLPILGFPILPSFNFDFALDLDCPDAALAGWGN